MKIVNILDWRSKLAIEKKRSPTWGQCIIALVPASSQKDFAQMRLADAETSMHRPILVSAVRLVNIWTLKRLYCRQGSSDITVRTQC